MKLVARFLVSAPSGGPGATACESPLSFSGTGRSAWTAPVIAEVADHHRLRLDMPRRAGAEELLLRVLRRNVDGGCTMSAVVISVAGDPAASSSLGVGEKSAPFERHLAESGTFSGSAAVASAENRRWWTLACLSGHSW